MQRSPKVKFPTMNAVLYGSLSRERTHIISTDPFEAPVLDPAYYAHPLDFETHVKGIELSRKIFEHHRWTPFMKENKSLEMTG